MTLVRLNVIGHSWGGMFNYPASTCWLIDCALAHYPGHGTSVKVQNMMYGKYMCVVLCLFLDNSDSPSIVEQ